MDRLLAHWRAQKAHMDGSNQLSIKSEISSVEYWSAVMEERISVIRKVSVRSSHTDIDRAHRVLAEEVHSLNMLLNYARRRRNALSAIFRIPPDVLARIFSFLQQDPGQESLGWIIVTHVCHRWRNIALKHPHLWSSLTFRLGVRWFTEMASRARSVPLVLTEDGRLPRPFNKDLARGLMCRVQHFSAGGLEEHLVGLASLLRKPMPLLETFKMDCIHNPHQNDDVVVSIMPKAPFRCISRRAEATSTGLRHFCLHGGRLLGAFPPLPHITHFEISGPSADGRPHGFKAYAFPSLSDVLESLESMPRLEILILCNPLFPASNELYEQMMRWGPAGKPTAARIRLSYLKYLSIGGTAFECAALLQHISLPSSTSFNLDYTGRIADEGHTDHPPADDAFLFDPGLHRLLLGILNLCAHDIKNPFFSIWVSPTVEGFNLRAQRSTGDDEAPRRMSLRVHQPYMQLSVRGLGDDALPGFFDAFGCESIRTLSISSSRDFRRYSQPPEIDWKVFARCSRVRHVRVSGTQHVASFLAAFNPEPSPNGDGKLVQALDNRIPQDHRQRHGAASHAPKHLNDIARRESPPLPAVHNDGRTRGRRDDARRAPRQDERQVPRRSALFPKLRSVWLHNIDFTGQHEDLADCFLNVVSARRGTLKTVYARGSSLPAGLAEQLSHVVKLYPDHQKGPPFITGIH